MRKEAEYLLKILGNPHEDRSGSMSFLDLASSIERGEKSLRLDATHVLPISRRAYADACRQLPPFFPVIADFAFGNLISFLYFSKLTEVASIPSTYKHQDYYLSDYSDENVTKRAELLRFVQNHSPEKYTVEELRKEGKVKAKHPWTWLDAMAVVDFKEAGKEIKIQISKTGDSRNLYCRIPGMAHRLNPEDVRPVLASFRDKRFLKSYEGCLARRDFA